jgi:hypothetical protein
VASAEPSSVASRIGSTTLRGRACCAGAWCDEDGRLTGTITDCEPTPEVERRTETDLLAELSPARRRSPGKRREGVEAHDRLDLGELSLALRQALTRDALHPIADVALARRR